MAILLSKVTSLTPIDESKSGSTLLRFNKNGNIVIKKLIKIRRNLKKLLKRIFIILFLYLYKIINKNKTNSAMNS